MRTYVIVVGEWCVSGHEEMQLWRWNQWCSQSNQIIIHIRWIPQCCRAHRHNCRYKRIDLGEARILNEDDRKQTYINELDG